MKTNVERLADSWIERYKVVQTHGDKSDEAASTVAAYQELEHLIATDPDLAWDVILRICQGTSNEFVLDNLAAGPLETLLSRHGDRFIDRVESLSRADDKFKWILGGVWQGGMDEAIWSRVQQASS